MKIWNGRLIDMAPDPATADAVVVGGAHDGIRITVDPDSVSRGTVTLRRFDANGRERWHTYRHNGERSPSGQAVFRPASITTEEER